MIIYLCCEGATDYAVIPPLMKKAADTVEMDVHWIKKSELKKITFHRKKNVAISARKKMIKALAITAERDKVSYIAYHNDADRRRSFCGIPSLIKTALMFSMFDKQISSLIEA